MSDGLERRGVLTVTANPALDHTVIVPHFREGAVNRVREERRDIGGKGVNVAAFLADAGVPVGVTGFLGIEDAMPFERFFAERNIADDFVRVAGTIRVNLKIVDDAGGSVTDINFPGPRLETADVDLLAATVERLARSREWVVLSGSLPPDAPTDLYARLVTAAREAGAETALDTSGEALRLGVEARPTLIKPNIDELRELLDRPVVGGSHVARAVAELHRRGIGVVIVSMGAEGGIFGEDGKIVQTRSPSVPLVSTVGAGDASLAGFLIARLAGGTLEECAVQATARGAAAVTTVGPHLPPPERVAELVRLVEAS